MTVGVMTAAQVVQIVESLTTAGVQSWIMGGWGIDALVGRETREHHDLDLLVSTSDLPVLDARLRDEGFARAYEWDEDAPVHVAGRRWHTAFVDQHPDGREIDVHAIRREGHLVSLATTDPWILPSRPLDGTGTIGGRVVSCVTAAAQRAMHRGYEMPEKHRADLCLLDRLQTSGPLTISPP